MDSNPIHHPSPAKKNEMLVFRLRSLLMICLADWWTWTPSATLFRIKNEMLIFGLHSTSDDWPGWLMDSNPNRHPSSVKKWNPHFWITFNFWWLARLVNGLEPHLPPLSSQKNEMLIFGLHSLWMIGQAGQWTQTPSTTPLQPIKWNASFWIMLTTDDQPGWSMDLNPICHPSPAKKMKCFFLDYVQLLMIGWAAWLTWTPSTTPLHPKTWNACLCITFNFWWLAGLVDGLKPHPPPLSSQKREMLIFGLHSTSDNQPGWSMDSNPIHHPSPAKNVKCSFLDYIQLLIISRAGQWTRTPSTTPLHPKTWNACLCITFNIWCWPDWSMDSNPIHHPSPAQKMKCSFLDYVQLLIIGTAGWWTQTPSASPLQPKKWNATFWITFNFWWSAWLVDGLEPHLPALCSQKNEMLLFGLRSTSDDWLD